MAPVFSGFTHRVVVGISDKAVSNSTNVILSTFALGSCIGVVGFDPVSKVGGMLHFMLPDSTRHPDRNHQPCMFADTGIPLLMDEFRSVRGNITRSHWVLIGAASVINATKFFRIGQDNIEAARSILGRLGIQPVYEELGGTINRTVHLAIATGTLSIKRPAETVDVDLN